MQAENFLAIFILHISITRKQPDGSMKQTSMCYNFNFNL